MNIQIAQSLTQFETMQAAWDELWSHSQNDNPISKFGPLHSALRHFCSNDDVRAIMVFDGQRPAIGIVLVKQKLKKIVTVFSNANNPWGNWGQLLVDSHLETAEVYDQLVRGIRQATKSLLQFSEIASASSEWRKLIDAFQRDGRSICATPAYYFAEVEHDENWSAFQLRLTGGFRRKLAKYVRNLRAEGELSFDHHSQFDDDSLGRLVTEAFELENRGWKGQQSTSVIKSNKFDFFVEQARLLAPEGGLRISFLRLDGKAIAFEFSAIGENTLMSWKIGYDPMFARFSPGQVLTLYRTQYFHEHQTCSVQDMMGPVTDATSRWSTRYQLKSNVLVSGHTAASKAQASLLLRLRALKGPVEAITCPTTGLAPKVQQISSCH